MKKRQCSLDEARDFVKSKRAVIQPNRAFIRYRITGDSREGGREERGRRKKVTVFQIIQAAATI